MKKNADLAARVLEQAAESFKYIDVSPISQFAEVLLKNPIFQVTEALADDPFLSTVEAIADSSILQLGKELENSRIILAAEEAIQGIAAEMTQMYRAINATASIQTVNLGLLQSWQEAVSPLNHLILDNNAILGSMMVDLEATVSKLGEPISQSIRSLVNQTAWTTKFFDTYFLDVVKDLQFIPPIEKWEMSLTIPTVGTASLIGSTRSFVARQTPSQLGETPEGLYVARTHTYSEKYVTLTQKLETYLRPLELGQHFINKWEGAWQAYNSTSMDRHSQATHSARELIMQVLAYLAPDSVFTIEECKKYGVDKPSRKMRVKHILGFSHESIAEWVESMATAINKTHDVVVAEAHRHDDKSLDDAIFGQLTAVGALLVVLLSMHDNDKAP